MSINRNGLPFQPGEASWASWKCGGGPHENDAFDFVHPAVREQPALAATVVLNTVMVIPYGGSETEADVTYTVHTLNEEYANLPA